jgi:hypothetical protein
MGGIAPATGSAPHGRAGGIRRRPIAPPGPSPALRRGHAARNRQVGGASLIGRQLVEPISAILRFTAKWITEQARRRFGLVMWHTPGVKDVVSRDMPERREPS